MYACTRARSTKLVVHGAAGQVAILHFCRITLLTKNARLVPGDRKARLIATQYPEASYAQAKHCSTDSDVQNNTNSRIQAQLTHRSTAHSSHKLKELVSKGHDYLLSHTVIFLVLAAKLCLKRALPSLFLSKAYLCVYIESICLI